MHHSYVSTYKKWRLVVACFSSGVKPKLTGSKRKTAPRSLDCRSLNSLSLLPVLPFRLSLVHMFFQAIPQLKILLLWLAYGAECTSEYLMGEGINITSIITLFYSLHFLTIDARKYQWQIACKKVHTSIGKKVNL